VGEWFHHKIEVLLAHVLLVEFVSSKTQSAEPQRDYRMSQSTLPHIASTIFYHLHHPPSMPVFQGEKQNSNTQILNFKAGRKYYLFNIVWYAY
jgi:hypothetical protein